MVFSWPDRVLTDFFGNLIDERVNASAGAFECVGMGSDHLYQLRYVGRHLRRDQDIIFELSLKFNALKLTVINLLRAFIARKRCSSVGLVPKKCIRAMVSSIATSSKTLE